MSEGSRQWGYHSQGWPWRQQGQGAQRGSPRRQNICMCFACCSTLCSRRVTFQLQEVTASLQALRAPLGDTCSGRSEQVFIASKHVTRTYTVLSTENVYHSAAADTQMLSLKSITTLQWVTAAPLMVSHGAYFKSETNCWQ